VVITGIGLVTSLGVGVPAFWRSLVEGQAGVRRITAFDTSSYSAHTAGVVEDIDYETYGLPKKLLIRRSRATLYGLVAAQLATWDAGLPLRPDEREGTGVIMATSTPPGEHYEMDHARYLRGIVGRTRPTAMFRGLPLVITGSISVRHNLQGVSKTLVKGAVGGMQAVVDGYQTIARGENHTVLAGGVDVLVTPFLFDLMCRTHMLSPSKMPHTACRPFDAHRDGKVVADGACVLVLESLRHAWARGARIYAEPVGWGMATGGWSLRNRADVGSPEETHARSLRRSLRPTELDPQGIDLVLAHACGLKEGDREEVLALIKLFRDADRLPPVVSIFGAMGDPMAAGGPIQLAAACLMMRHGLIAPTVNCQVREPLDPFDHVTDGLRRCQGLTNVLVHAQSRTGSSIAMVLRQFTRVAYDPYDQLARASLAGQMEL
jgi:3-oxoacyl-[acyl-carrier-protein] synthase II